MLQIRIRCVVPWFDLIQYWSSVCTRDVNDNTTSSISNCCNIAFQLGMHRISCRIIRPFFRSVIRPDHDMAKYATRSLQTEIRNCFLLEIANEQFFKVFFYKEEYCIVKEKCTYVFFSTTKSVIKVQLSGPSPISIFEEWILIKLRINLWLQRKVQYVELDWISFHSLKHKAWGKFWANFSFLYSKQIKDFELFIAIKKRIIQSNPNKFTTVRESFKNSCCTLFKFKGFIARFLATFSNVHTFCKIHRVRVWTIPDNSIINSVAKLEPAFLEQIRIRNFTNVCNIYLVLLEQNYWYLALVLRLKKMCKQILQKILLLHLT